jgi:DNA modification methylase
LPIQCIQAAGLEGSGIICDPFMGSGTTGEAALKLGHRFVGFELDADACKMANDRLHDATGRWGSRPDTL